MSGYNGRRAPNFSQYLNELNAVPHFVDQSAPQSQLGPHDHDLFDGDAELAMFTNAEFLDFDAMGGDLSAPPVNPGPELEAQKPAKDQQEDVNYMDMLNGESCQHILSTETVMCYPYLALSTGCVVLCCFM